MIQDKAVEDRMRRRCLELIASLLTAAALATSKQVPDGNDAGQQQSVTVGASWLQRRRGNDVVDEVVHSVDDYVEQTTITPQSSRRTSTHNVSMQFVHLSLFRLQYFFCKEPNDVIKQAFHAAKYTNVCRLTNSHSH